MQRRPAGRRFDAHADGPPACCRQLTGIQPDRSVNPDEAVARGAALYAGHLLAERAGAAGSSTFQVTNVNAHSLGVEGIDTDTLRKKNVVLIPRNTPLPARYTERFATKSEGQRSIVIKVLEGESSQPGDCIAIGRTVVRDLPAGLPKGWPVEVTFEYGANGRLAVAVVPGTHHQAPLELDRETGLSDDGMARWKCRSTRQPASASSGAIAHECWAVRAPRRLCRERREFAAGAMPRWARASRCRHLAPRQPFSPAGRSQSPRPAGQFPLPGFPCPAPRWAECRRLTPARPVRRCLAR